MERDEYWKYVMTKDGTSYIHKCLADHDAVVCQSRLFGYDEFMDDGTTKHRYISRRLVNEVTGASKPSSLFVLTTETDPAKVREKVRKHLEARIEKLERDLEKARWIFEGVEEAWRQ